MVRRGTGVPCGKKGYRVPCGKKGSIAVLGGLRGRVCNPGGEEGKRWREGGGGVEGGREGGREGGWVGKGREEVGWREEGWDGVRKGWGEGREEVEWREGGGGVEGWSCLHHH